MLLCASFSWPGVLVPRDVRHLFIHVGWHSFWYCCCMPAMLVWASSRVQGPALAILCMGLCVLVSSYACCAGCYAAVLVPGGNVICSTHRGHVEFFWAECTSMSMYTR